MHNFKIKDLKLALRRLEYQHNIAGDNTKPIYNELIGHIYKMIKEVEKVQK